jgi:hypothetical protein
VGDVVPIDNVVVPVSLTRLQSFALEAERAFPRPGLGGPVMRKGKLSGVVVPGTDKMYGFDSRGGTEVETDLNGRHVWVDF